MNQERAESTIIVLWCSTENSNNSQEQQEMSCTLTLELSLTLQPVHKEKQMI